MCTSSLDFTSKGTIDGKQRMLNARANGREKIERKFFFQNESD